MRNDIDEESDDLDDLDDLDESEESEDDDRYFVNKYGEKYSFAGFVKAGWDLREFTWKDFLKSGFVTDGDLSDEEIKRVRRYFDSNGKFII